MTSGASFGSSILTILCPSGTKKFGLIGDGLAARAPRSPQLAPLVCRDQSRKED